MLHSHHSPLTSKFIFYVTFFCFPWSPPFLWFWHHCWLLTNILHLFLHCSTLAQLSSWLKYNPDFCFLYWLLPIPLKQYATSDFLYLLHLHHNHLVSLPPAQNLHLIGCLTPKKNSKTSLKDQQAHNKERLTPIKVHAYTLCSMEDPRSTKGNI